MMHGLKITDISIHVCRSQPAESPLLAFARIVLNDALVINGIRIIKSRSLPFISFPRDFNKKEGREFNICHPIRKDLHDEISKEILAAYQEACDQGRPKPIEKGPES